MPEPPAPREDQARTRKDIRAALIFGIAAATIEMAILLYLFFR